MSTEGKNKEQTSTEYREWISVEEAVRILVANSSRITETEKVPLLHAGGRILAGDMVAERDNPPFDRSPIDGYACRSDDIRDASRENPVFLHVVDEVDAGQYTDRTVQPKEAVRIMTGAPIPAGSDCCVTQEDTDCGEETVAVYTSVPRHGNFCDRGEDFEKGIRMLADGERLDSIDIANLAAMGVSDVPVYVMPRIALITTGEELEEPGEALLPGKIYDSNRYLLAARLAELGMPPFLIRHTGDDADAAAGAILEAIGEGADLILTTGGVSVGKRDILHDTIRQIGARKLFWRVLLKPGMPTIFSLCQGVPIVSLSGNPFGALANLELLVRPMLAEMTGDSSLLLSRVTGQLRDDFPKASGGRRFVRARYEDGAVLLPDTAAPDRESNAGVRHSSGVLASMRGCNCLIDIPAGSPPLHAGEMVTVCLLERAQTTDVSGGTFQIKRPVILAVSGVKNAGKTTLITSLIPLLAEMGIQTAVLKHDSHGFDPDVPGTDTYRFREAGACGTAIFSEDLSMVIRHGTVTERVLANAFPDADLILLEGFKWTAYPKIEIVRGGVSDVPACSADTLIGIATDLTDTAHFPTDIPVLDLNRPEEIAAFLCRYLAS